MSTGKCVSYTGTYSLVRTQVVLLGDQCQLGPTVSARHPGSLPLFNRLIDDGMQPLLLDEQVLVASGTYW